MIALAAYVFCSILVSLGSIIGFGTAFRLSSHSLQSEFKFFQALSLLTFVFMGALSVMQVTATALDIPANASSAGTVVWSISCLSWSIFTFAKTEISLLSNRGRAALKLIQNLLRYENCFAFLSGVLFALCYEVVGTVEAFLLLSASCSEVARNMIKQKIEPKHETAIFVDAPLTYILKYINVLPRRFSHQTSETDAEISSTHIALIRKLRRTSQTFSFRVGA